MRCRVVHCSFVIITLLYSTLYWISSDPDSGVKDIKDKGHGHNSQSNPNPSPKINSYKRVKVRLHEYMSRS